MVDRVLDTSGSNCPLPLLKTKKELSKMNTGQILQVTATDAGFVKDIEVFCNVTENELLSNTTDGVKYTFEIKKV